MSRQVRNRVAALVLGGLLLGAPLLTNGTANAEQSEAGARQVVFGGGGVLGLSCRSTPDVGAMTVPADSTVRVVNRTGHSARLRLGGTAKGTIPDDGSTDVVFRRGTTPVMLSPNCALGDQATPLMVTATPSAPVTLPNPDPGPSDDDAVPVAPSDGSPAAAPTSGSALPDAMGTGTRPHRTSTVRPGASRPGAVRHGPSGTASKIKNGITRGTQEAAPTFAGMPPGDDKTIVGGVPTLELPSPAVPSSAVPSSSVPSSSVSAASELSSAVPVSAAAEPVATMEPMRGTGSVGLLGVVAGVCVIGVAVGAIRAIVSQRASRTNMA
jgi:hypothetical protein